MEKPGSHGGPSRPTSCRGLASARKARAEEVPGWGLGAGLLREGWCSERFSEVNEKSTWERLQW